MKQTERKKTIDIGPHFDQVSPVSYWYRGGYFRNQDEAIGAFKLAYQQGLDGMGPSIQLWMGLTDAEFDAWMRDDALPAQSGLEVSDAAAAPTSAASVFGYITWLGQLNQGEFEYVMRKAGHGAKAYISEKWEEFSSNKIQFARNWHEELFAYFSSIADIVVTQGR